MRKARQNVVLDNIRNVSTGYHDGGYSGNTNYAFLGFRENKYFTSDRTIKLDTNFNPVASDGTPLANKILKGFGLEIEVECWSVNERETLATIIDRIATEELPNDLFKYQRDGSLSGGNSSIECITQVMSKEFIRNNYVGFKRMFEWFKKFDISASRSGNCGMHVNMSVGMFGGTPEKREEAIKKFIYLVNKHYNVMCYMVKRSLSRTGYCSKMSRWTDKNYAKGFNLSRTNEYDTDHSICFNYAHYNTGRVELRLVGGQDSYYSFRNTMETIFHIVDRVKTISWDGLDNLVDVFKGCNKYVVKRLDDVLNANLLDTDTYNEIVRNSDTETDFGRNL